MDHNISCIADRSTELLPELPILCGVQPYIKCLDVGINAGNADGEELHGHVGVWGEFVLSGVCHRQVNVLLLGNMQTVGGHFNHPRVRDDHPGTWCSSSEFVNSPEFCVDRRSYCPPARLWEGMNSECPG